MEVIRHPRALFSSFVRPVVLDRKRKPGVPLTLQQLPLLASRLTPEALCGESFCPLNLSMFERVESTSNRFPADAELVREVCLVLAGSNAAPDSLDILVGQLGCRRHTLKCIFVGHLVGHMG